MFRWLACLIWSWLQGFRNGPLSAPSVAWWLAAAAAFCFLMGQGSGTVMEAVFWFKQFPVFLAFVLSVTASAIGATLEDVARLIREGSAKLAFLTAALSGSVFASMLLGYAATLSRFYCVYERRHSEVRGLVDPRPDLMAWAVLGCSLVLPLLVGAFSAWRSFSSPRGVELGYTAADVIYARLWLIVLFVVCQTFGVGVVPDSTHVREAQAGRGRGCSDVSVVDLLVNWRDLVSGVDE